MADVLTGAALFILAVTAVALFRVLRARTVAERMMAVQLLGTGGAAALLLLGAASGSAATIDVALLLALFAAFSCVAFVMGGAGQGGDRKPSEDRP
ncbi:monovalent cation/H+ antiporter complex subunit F [Bosea sp. NBC_00550]|uniref:monovalent cation/H+ antiporter complex subunit F n=1 Tax=Bosea sp. NBC_00550 TaxID=2969621 RepID=UPI0022324BCF|nr:monovalent cation/H+ antiporter complex subunit F [Bosea sp. NBC_00550]UZF93648.1 monovalent cation/H+ antiporter complex subunit F [Bosea sp. NBC_00550]